MNTSQETTVFGASLGAALGVLVAGFLELYTDVQIPDPMQGALVIVCTALVALVYPANRER